MAIERLDVEISDPAASPLRSSRRRRLLIGGALLATALLAVTAVLVGVVVEQERGDDDDDDDDRYDDDDGVYNPGGWDADTSEDPRVAKLKAEIHLLTIDQAKARFGEIKPKRKAPPRQNKIDHLVVLYMENHASDNFFGCMDLPGYSSLKNHTIPVDPDDPSKGIFPVECGTADYVCKGGPGYDTFASKFPKDGKPNLWPYSPQDDKYSALHGASKGATAVKMFSPEQVPIKAALAKEFGVFNKLYTAVPSASSPNHLFTQSATSCGMQHNGLYNDCLGPTASFPQFTIYDSMRADNVSFELYMNSTCGLDGLPCHGEKMPNADAASAISTPDVAMAGVARHKDRYRSHEVFYQRAANGTLPALSWVHPPMEACDHPCYDVAKGERLLKDVYEAVRAGPKWSSTLLVVAYDDAGGFYDSVVPPYEGVPADDAPCHLTGPDTKPTPYKCPGGGNQFDFRRLGLRSTAMLIGPHVPKGAVFQEPKGPTPTSQFELSSIPATVKNLFNLSSFLTKRDAWAGSFDELLLNEPRTDTLEHLPDAPAPASPWSPPPPEEASEASPSSAERRVPFPAEGKSTSHNRHALSTTEEQQPQHCSSPHGEVEQMCAGTSKANLKQRRNIQFLSAYTKSEPVDLDALSHSEADRIWKQLWRKWMEMDGPLA